MPDLTGTPIPPHHRRRSTTCVCAFVIAASAWCARPVAGQGVPDLFRITGGVSDTALQYRPFVIPPGKEEVLADLKGPGKVTYFYITDDSSGKLDPELVLKVYWDGAREPSIHVPLADFFGAVGGRTIDFQSALFQINHFCYMCYVPMPFSRSARFVLANDGEREYRRNVAYAVDWESDPRYAGEPSRLHACWKRSNPTSGLHKILETEGGGHYVGGFLQVYTRYQGWWGEGDTLFRRDGKAITHSPGTEDEYGSTWGFGDKTFVSQNCGYIESAGGQNRMYRWYLANPVRFRESLKVEIQNQRYDRAQVPSNDDYISIAFWYLDCVQPVELAPYTTRTAPSKASKYAK
jgi:D-arabinan exo alpha-(1,3)/(1,5)-arabinofuranosidase (non-reducing end)